MNRIQRCSFGRRFVLTVYFTASILLISSRSLAVNPEQVDAALDRAKLLLYSRQSNGIWEKDSTPPTDAEVASFGYTATGGQWGGTTALAVYALLAAGESPLDPRLAPAIKFLKTVDIKGSYGLGLRAQIWPFLPPSKEVRLMAEEDVVRFENAIIKKPPAIGLYDYLLDSKRSNRVDHSVSQYGVLGMWACERSGAEVPTGFWETVEEAWNRDQQPDGGWCYPKAPIPTHPETASMTVAGVATLFITQDYVHATNGVNCTGNIVNPHIDAGLKWLDQHFEQVFTDRGADSPYYAIYGVERVGVASGRKYLGSVNWYQRGADYLLKYQNRAGGWGGVPDTCFAMLFLSRGRAPVLFNKLQYDTASTAGGSGKEGNWNERPRDVANLMHWISKQTERDLNWQIVNLDGSVGELLDAPVLFISGNKALNFTPEQQAKLREYCEDGGLILGNPDCGSSEFTGSFLKLGKKLFHGYEFRNLPARHPIYVNEQYPRSGWRPAPTVLSLSNGIRELMVLTNNSDPARYWQLEETNHHLADYQLADDVALYAIDKKNLTEKGETFVVETNPAVHMSREIKLARLEYTGNWDPEPGGWRRMVAILHNNASVDLRVSDIKLGSEQLGDGTGEISVATLTGTSAIKLTAAQRQELKVFVTGGGTLIVDAAGGSSEFASTVESQLQTIFGTEAAVQLKTPLPATDPIFNMRGGVIRGFGYRSFARDTVGSTRSPLLTAIRIENRPAVFYSREDLSAGIVGSPTDGIIGYDPQVATKIMTNLVIAGGLGERAVVNTVAVKK